MDRTVTNVALTAVINTIHQPPALRNIIPALIIYLFRGITSRSFFFFQEDYNSSVIIEGRRSSPLSRPFLSWQTKSCSRIQQSAYEIQDMRYQANIRIYFLVLWLGTTSHIHIINSTTKMHQAKIQV